MDESLLRTVWEHFNQITPFSKEEFDNLAARSYLMSLKKGEIVYRQGSIPMYGGYVIKGGLRNFYTSKLDRKQITTGFQFENTCFGDLRSIFYNEHALTSLEATEETTIIRLDKKHYLELFDNCKPFAKVMMLSMENRYNELVGETIERIDREAEERYLKMLDAYPHILQRVPQRHIASYLGIKPQSLSRIRRNIMGRPAIA
ncbi:MAG TPA: Crp/Fnr family transcriptional regulator [Cyclobacteriaceae bacterium]|nr:Crp/Fnr family transcriptional regulator [Cyclobacteriaceae bacterium]